jgi:hypothetical protein
VLHPPLRHFAELLQKYAILLRIDPQKPPPPLVRSSRAPLMRKPLKHLLYLLSEKCGFWTVELPLYVLFGKIKWEFVNLNAMQTFSPFPSRMTLEESQKSFKKFV